MYFASPSCLALLHPSCIRLNSTAYLLRRGLGLPPLKYVSDGTFYTYYCTVYVSPLFSSWSTCHQFCVRPHFAFDASTFLRRPGRHEKYAFGRSRDFNFSRHCKVRKLLRIAQLDLVEIFLVATKRLYMRVCPSVGRMVRRSVRNQFFFGLLGATNVVYTALFVTHTSYHLYLMHLLFQMQMMPGVI